MVTLKNKKSILVSLLLIAALLSTNISLIAEAHEADTYESNTEAEQEVSSQYPPNEEIEPEISDEEKAEIDAQAAKDVSEGKYKTLSANSGVLQRIEQLKDVYPEGSFFTVNGKSCGAAWHTYCDNCKLANILAARHPELVGKMSAESWSCCAFARFAFYFIFGIGTDKSNVNMTYAGNNLSAAYPGDYIIYYDNAGNRAHYGIYLSGNEVIDSNASGGVACRVKYGNSWASNYYSRVEVYRANNYNKIENTDYGIFSDVKTSDWYYDAVNNVKNRGIMTGLTSSYFGVNENIARAHFAIVMHRIAGTPSTNYTSIFSDVSSSATFASAVTWAHNNGIMTGYTDGRFGTNDPLKKEQLATILYRYAQSKGLSTSTKASLSSYPDSAKVSSYAVEAMKWAVGMGIISGEGSNGSLNPYGSANRAVCAVMITRFLNQYGL